MNVAVVTACIILASSLLGCGSRASEQGAPAADQLVEECEAFLASYQRCLSSLGPGEIVTTRVAQTRQTLAAEAARGGNVREALRLKCSANLSSLTASCH